MVSLGVVVSAGMLMSAEAVGKPMFTYLLTYLLVLLVLKFS